MRCSWSKKGPPPYHRETRAESKHSLMEDYLGHSLFSQEASACRSKVITTVTRHLSGTAVYLE